MLVLTLRPHHALVFPGLGVSLQLFEDAAQTVRVEVEAPRSVPVHCDEVQTAGEARETSPAPERSAEDAERRVRHFLRGRLNTATMALFLAQRQLQSGRAAHAEATLRQALDELGTLERDLAALGESERKVPRRRIRTLLVEDNQHERALLESYLRLSGVDVANAGDGQEALAYLSTHEPPDAVLLDMSLPRCDGPALLAAMRENPTYAGVKVFAVSGARPADVELPAGPASVDGWFTKPLDPASLVNTLTTALG